MAKMDKKKKRKCIEGDSHYDQSSSLSVYLPVHAFVQNNVHWSSISFFTYLSVCLIVFIRL